METTKPALDRISELQLLADQWAQRMTDVLGHLYLGQGPVDPLEAQEIVAEARVL